MIVKTDSLNKDFISLVKELDADLAARNGSDHGFYSQFNKIDAIKFVLVAYEDGMPVGCGAIKEFSDRSMEVKRMYVVPSFRGKGIAREILRGLEQWAKELSYQKCVLETGTRLETAIHLYRNSGYKMIPNYGQYRGVVTSVCFEKDLID